MSMHLAVQQFHEAVGHPVHDRPQQLPPERLRLRLALIAEEFVELALALTGHDSDSNEAKAAKGSVTRWLYHWMEAGGEADLVDVARQLADLHYVLSGTSVEHGIPEDAVFYEVHAANMRKVGGGQRADGKQQRPADWQPPDVAMAMAAAAQEVAAP